MRSSRNRWLSTVVFSVGMLGLSSFGLPNDAPAQVSERHLHYYALELDGGALANPTTPEVSMHGNLRCQEQVNGINLDLVGSTHTPDTGIVTIVDPNIPAPPGSPTLSGQLEYGQTAVTPDPVHPGMGAWNFSFIAPNLFTTCPTEVTAIFDGTGASFTATVVKDSPAPAIPSGFLEGPLDEITLSNPAFGNQSTVRVNGVLAIVPPGTPIESPTVNGLTFADLTGATLPGRTSPGFTNSTCLCESTVNGDGTHTMVAMMLEPAENVVVGTVTEHTCVTASCDPDENPSNVLRINGIPMDVNTDSRILSEPPTHLGFEVDLALSPSLVGVVAAAEGYYGMPIAPTPPVTVTLTLLTNGTGTGTVTGAGPYVSGTSATMTATPTGGSTFDGWTGAPGCAGSTSHSILMDADKTCTATFNAAVAVDPNRITGFVLWNADNDTSLGPLTSVVDRTALCNGCNLNIQAIANDTEGATQSVRFALDGNPNARTESGAPYMLGGDSGGNIFVAGGLTNGTHTITATPYSANGANGTPGTALSATFTIQ